MLKSLKRTLTLCASVLIMSSLQIGFAAGITTNASYISPEYWNNQNPNADAVILDSKGVTDLNNRIVNESKTVFNLAKYPQTVTSASLKTKIMDYKRLVNGNPTKMRIILHKFKTSNSEDVFGYIKIFYL